MTFGRVRGHPMSALGGAGCQQKNNKQQKDNR